jgi:hypothetical protein
LPDGEDRSALSEDFFASDDGYLDPGCLLSALGSLGSKSKKPLIMKSMDNSDQGRCHIYNHLVRKMSTGGSPTSLKSNQALEKFRELVGVPVTEKEENILIMHFPNYFRLLKMGRLNKEGAEFLLRLLKTTLKSETLKSVRVLHSFVFGRSIDTGGGKAILQKVFSLETGGLFCAKVFLNVGSSVGSYSAISEYKVSQNIGRHENIVPILSSIEFCHQSGSKDPLMALMMPLYNWSLAELLVCFHKDPLPFGLFKQIALGLLAAGAEFQAKSYSHCDIKPSNIMLNGLTPVLIDFGAVVPLGSSTVEHTPFYALDASHDVVTSEFDLFCIVTTLVTCFAPAFELQKRTKLEMICLINDLCSNTIWEEYCLVCRVILECSSSQEGLGRIQNL